MKKIYTLLLITIAFQLIPFTPAVASNYLGGEITWQCMANGQYIFRLTLYRDCGGLGFPQIVSDTNNSPQCSNYCGQ
jgi:hypothetical protein